MLSLEEQSSSEPKVKYSLSSHPTALGHVVHNLVCGQWGKRLGVSGELYRARLDWAEGMVNKACNDVQLAALAECQYVVPSKGNGS